MPSPDNLGTVDRLDLEILRAHDRLDQEGVPRHDDAGRDLGLVLRISVLVDQLSRKEH